MFPNLLVISAKKRCGKDETANRIKTFLGEDKIVTYALAEPIKQALMFGLTRADVRNPLTRERLTYLDVNGETEFDRESDLEISHYQLITTLMSAWEMVASSYQYELEHLTSEVERLIEAYTNECNEPWTIRRFMQVFGTDICVAADTMVWMKFMCPTYMDAIELDKTVIITDCRQPHEMKALRAMGATFIFVNRKGYSDVETDSHITEKGLQPEPNDIIVDNDGNLEDLDEIINKIVYNLK